MSPSTLEDGVYPDVRRDRYDRIGRVNISTLKVMEDSPAHYQWCVTHPTPDTDAMKVGRVSHLAAFEPETFRARVAVWDGGTRRGKDWDAFKQRNDGLELLTLTEHERCMAIQAAVRADKHAQSLVAKGRGEVTMLWSVEIKGKKIECKGRIDFDAQSAIVDLKTTRDASPDAFGRQCFDLDYCASAAWYVDGYFKVTGIRKPYKIVAVESDAPYVVQVYNVPEELLDLGRETYLGWLEKLVYCRELNWWPGYSDQELDLTLPRWAMPADDIEGLGLEVGS